MTATNMGVAGRPANDSGKTENIGPYPTRSD